jgi:hypothetical protein
VGCWVNQRNRKVPAAVESSDEAKPRVLVD